MPSPEIVFKPKYTGTMRFAFYLWPLWLILFLFFIYRAVALRSYNPDGFLIIIFGIMTFSMPFRVFREMQFGERLVIKRYVLPDVVIEYKDVLEFNSLKLRASTASVSLYLMTRASFDELQQIIQKLMSARKIKLKKKDD